jgi:hypothetical protein
VKLTVSGHFYFFYIFLALTPNGGYWQPSTDLKNEGYFNNDPDVPNDRESLVLDYNTDFAVAVRIIRPVVTSGFELRFLLRFQYYF